MSVSITISGNVQFCDRNGLFREIHDDYGIMREYPFDMNLANGNFAALWSAMGMDSMYGDIYPQKLAARVRALKCEDVVREESSEFGSGGCEIINCGLPAEQVSRYIEALSLMCEEAERREEKIVWG